MNAQPAESQHRTVEAYLTAVEDLLRQVIGHGRFDLKFAVRQTTAGVDQTGEPAYVFDFAGADEDLLLERNGALLDALETVILKAVRLDEEYFGKIAFDCQDFRRARLEELKLMAQVAAERVIESGDPFPLNPMSARERRIVHLTLKDQHMVRTESEGFGTERRVVIVPVSK